MTTENVNEITCPECGGRRRTVLTAQLYPSGHTEVWVDCEFCKGEGSFPEDEYVIMKLEGRV